MMAAASSSMQRPIVLESIFDQDDEELPTSSSLTSPLRPRSTNSSLGHVFSALNELGSPKGKGRDISQRPTYGSSVSREDRFNPSTSAQDSDWQQRYSFQPEEEQDDLEGDAQWGAVSAYPEPPEEEEDEDDDDEEMEAMREAEHHTNAHGSSSRQAPSQPLILEDILGADEEPEEVPLRAAPQRTINLDEELSQSAMQASSSSSRLVPRPVAAPSTFSTSSTRSYEATIPKYIPAGHLGAISMDGEIVRFERRRRIKGWKPPPPHYGEAKSTGLLSRPIHQIIDSLRAQEAEDIVARNEAEAVRAAARPLKTKSARAAMLDGQVWVDRYRPKRFTELLGDERVHREVMSWLKEWDPCVFRRKNRKKMRDATHDGPAAPSKFVPYGQQAPEWKDPYDRPAQRVLLISGAPGLGKTTLAHVLAKAAGYGVYELNASDSRSAGSVTDTIKMALESASLKDSRPTCLVVDEIDGATGGGLTGGFGGGGGGEESRGFIKALVDLIEGGKGGKRVKGSKGAKGKKSKPLLRPIICICNDLYAPALRPLRPYCRLIRFQKPAANHLVGRLRSICEQESISASSRCLSLLAALSQGDIRSCLNALQLAKLKRVQNAEEDEQDRLVEVTESDIRDAGVGTKDGSTNLQTVWTALFRTPTPKERARKTAPWEGPALTNHLISLVHSSGEFSRLLQGCFEHYPSLNFVDDGWGRILEIHKWMEWGNELQDGAFKNGMFDLMGYVPWSFVKWNTLFANTVNSLPEWPRVDYEHRLKRQAFDEIALDLQSVLPASVRVQFTRDATITELGPLLMRILTPDLKTINNQLARAGDRPLLNQLIGVMLSLSISFVQERLEDGALTYRVDPPLEVFTAFDGKRSSSVQAGRFAVRSLVMKELEMEKIRRRNKDEQEDEEERGVGKNSSSKSARTALEAYKKNDALMAAALGGKKEKIALDFFGRPIAVKKQPQVEVSSKRPRDDEDEASLPAPILAARKARLAEAAAASEATTKTKAGSEGSKPSKQLKVHYRHNEGYSNAVRQPIKMSALL